MPEVVRTVGRYGIVRELGRGGMGVVWLAWQDELERHVALKELSAFHTSDPMFARRFVRESRLGGSIAHANVVTVLDGFEHEGTPYIAMEYLERGSLRPWIGRMTMAQIAGVLEGILAALDHAEQHGIVHRDLKPENVLVTRHGQVKVTDFGISTASIPRSATRTYARSRVGTPTYMGPEQATGKKL